MSADAPNPSDRDTSPEGQAWRQLTEEQQMALIFSTMTPVERANFKANLVRQRWAQQARDSKGEPVAFHNRSQRRAARRSRSNKP
jgi:hypothetical protein